MNHQFHDPPYARLENSKDEEMESEEGYETIPASERQNHNGNLVYTLHQFWWHCLKIILIWPAASRGLIITTEGVLFFTRILGGPYQNCDTFKFHILECIYFFTRILGAYQNVLLFQNVFLLKLFLCCNY